MIAAGPPAKRPPHMRRWTCGRCGAGSPESDVTWRACFPRQLWAVMQNEVMAMLDGPGRSGRRRHRRCRRMLSRSPLAAGGRAGDSPPISGRGGATLAGSSRRCQRRCAAFQDADGKQLQPRGFPRQGGAAERLGHLVRPLPARKCRRSTGCRPTLGGEGLVVLPVSLDRGGGPRWCAVYYGQHGITHLGVYLDGKGGLSQALRIGGRADELSDRPRGAAGGQPRGRDAMGFARSPRPDPVLSGAAPERRRRPRR